MKKLWQFYSEALAELARVIAPKGFS